MTTYEKCRTIRNMTMNCAAKQIRNFPNEVKKMKDGKDLFGIQPGEMTDKQCEELGFGKWEENNPMRLIPLWLMPFLSDEIETESINGKKYTKKSAIDNDNRFGCLAYGVIPAEA